MSFILQFGTCQRAFRLVLSRSYIAAKLAVMFPVLRVALKDVKLRGVGIYLLMYQPAMRGGKVVLLEEMFGKF
jgi:hypothetical protein